MATGTIKYRKLNRAKNEIRLLELLPATDATAPVVCRLVTTPLTDDLEYLALSSLYGDHNDCSRIVVDDRPVLITTHLAQALKHVRTVFFPSLIRRQQEQQKQKQQQQRSRQQSGATGGPIIGGGSGSHDRPRAPRWLLSLLKGVNSILPNSPEEEERTPLRIWVDKSRQRSGIAAIYGSAKMTDAGLAAMHEIHSAMPRHWGDPDDEAKHPEDYSPQHRWTRSVTHIWAERESDGAPAFSLDHWVGAADFMHRPYFQRRWILEEIALARYPTFLIGDAIVSWKLILRMNKFMEEFKEKESEIFPVHLRSAIAEMPLGSIHALLDEFAKRRKSEKAESLDTTRTSERTKYTNSLASKHDSIQDVPSAEHEN
ncbi:heterokaryon incompatibility protein [Apiospora phragmitis]|uniref:Heterokaryon incompatibility protein n=1 Tax=Apiospora phragmitis TaxID=2905665 RepID=A0ABR1VJ55_9PEZI